MASDKFSNIAPKSYFRALIVSYIFILILPLCLLIVFVFNVYYSDFKKNIEEQHKDDLEKAAVTLDKEYMNIYRLFAQINSDTTISPFLFEDSPESSIQLQENLRNKTDGNGNILETFLYFKQDSYLNSTTTSINMNYLNLLYRFEHYEDSEIITLLKNCRRMQILPAQTIQYLAYNPLITEHEGITFLFPYQTSGTVMLFWDARKLLNSINYDNYTHLIVLDSSQAPILASSKEFYDICFQDAGERTDNLFQYKNKKYIISSSKSSITGLNYIYLSDYDKLFSSLYQHLFLFTGIIIVVIILLALLIQYFVNKNYAPILSLKQLTATIHNAEKGKEHLSQNELMQIQYVIESLNTANQELTHQYEDTKSYVRDNLLFGLYNGSFQSLNDFNEKGSAFGLTLSEGIYTVLLIRFTNDYFDQNDLFEMLPQSLFKEDQNIIDYRLQKHLESNKLILLIVQQELDYGQICKIAEKVKCCLDENKVMDIHIGIGSSYINFSLIPKSYIEAFNALEYRFFKAYQPIILFKDCISDKFIASFYADPFVEQLNEHIRLGQLSLISQTLLSLKKQFIDRQLPIFVIQGICFDIINLITGYFINNKLITDSKLSAVNFYELTRYDTVDKIFDLLNAACFKIYNVLKVTSNTSENSKIKEMLLYIEKNCSNADFSTAQMADDFKTTAPALCADFKNITGQTIFSYLTDCRLAKAKEILLSTDLPLSDICAKVGYYNVSSFIRRFKSIEGISPGAYRDMHQNSET